MVSSEHQKMLNKLATALEKEGVTITHLDIDNMPEHFDEKYKNLPTPAEIEGHIPDLNGIKNNLIHLGESKIDIYGDENIDSQLKIFSNNVMKEGNKPVPLHIIVPKSKENDLRKKISELDLNHKLKSGQIMIWIVG